MLFIVPVSIWGEKSFQALSVEGIYNELINSGPRYEVIESDVMLENEGQAIYGTLFMPIIDT